MVGRHQHHIAGLQLTVHLRQAPVEGFQCRGIARHVAAVAVEHVEIDEIAEDEIAVRRLVHGLKRRVHQRHVAVGLENARHAFVGKDVADLADAMHRAAGLHQPVEQRRFRRHDGIVAPVAGALESGGRLADEGSGDHPADIERIDQPPHDLAERQQAFEPEMRLVGCNLEDRVRGSVADRFAGADMLLAQPGDDLRSRGVAVAEDAGKLRLATDRLDQLRRKGVSLRRKVAPVEHDGRTRNLPVARRRILAVRDFVGRAVEAEHPLRLRHAGRRAPACQLGDRYKPQRRHVGKRQRSFAKTLAIAGARGAEFRDMAQSVGTVVAIDRGVRCTADAEGIKNEEKCACHGSPAPRDTAVMATCRPGGRSGMFSAKRRAWQTAPGRSGSPKSSMPEVHGVQQSVQLMSELIR